MDQRGFHHHPCSVFLYPMLLMLIHRAHTNLRKRSVQIEAIQRWLIPRFEGGETRDLRHLLFRP